MINSLLFKKLMLLYILLINIIGLLSMYIDKRKAKNKQWRIPESTLILISLLGGSIGSYIGMIKFRHKTKHAKFKIGIPLIIFFQIVIIFIIKNKII